MSAPLVALRYDMWPQIGMGHASRARVLAKELEKQGAKVIHAVPEAAIELVQTWTPASQIVIAVDSDDNAWNAYQRTASHIVLDTLWHTNAVGTAREVNQLNAQSNALITVVDSLPPDHFDCSDSTVHILLTPYLNADKYRPAPSTNTLWLSGAQYIFLDQEYEHYRNTHDSPAQPAVLISCGGSDSDQFSLTLCKLLIDTQVNLDVVVGPLFCDALVTELEMVSQNHPTLRLHYQPPSLAPLIASTSLVIGRPSLLRYEAAALSRYAVYLARGKAYKDYYYGFNEAGIADIFFDFKTDGQARFATRIVEIANQIHSGYFNPDNSLAGSTVKANGAKLFVDHLLKQA